MSASRFRGMALEFQRTSQDRNRRTQVARQLDFFATFASFAVKPLIYFQKLKTNHRKERKVRQEIKLTGYPELLR